MAEMMTIKEAAARWGITERRINALCKDGRISGAYKSDGRWHIPADAEKLLDQKLPGILIELKTGKDCSDERLKH